MIRKKYPPFLASEIENTPREKALFHILSAPMEKTVSYGGGASRGPGAILRASAQLEVWDGYSIPAEEGIYTHRPLQCRGSQERALERISAEVYKSCSSGAIPVLLGGEHTVTVGAFDALRRQSSESGSELPGIVQLDAHADLRESYEGSIYSHACAMKRGVDMGFKLFQLGVRSMSPPEVELRKEINIGHLDAADLHKSDLNYFSLPEDFPQEIYLTIDIDGFDPAVFPETGTPEPGGVMWPQFFTVLNRIAEQRKIIGFDVVELAPPRKAANSPFAAARLVYDVMGIIQRQRINFFPEEKNG
jgi:agmatinase